MTIKTSYRIPEQNLPKLNHKLEILNRRAEKLGTTPITLTVTGHEDEINKDKAINQVQRYLLIDLESIDGEARIVNNAKLATGPGRRNPNDRRVALHCHNPTRRAGQYHPHNPQRNSTRRISKSFP